MANEPTEAEDGPVYVNAQSIRDAILSYIPEDDNLVRDIKVHDGIVEVMLRWRSLRWSTCMAMQTQTPEEIAAKADEEFRFWLRKAILNMKDVPRHARVLGEMVKWLRENPDKHNWLYQDPPRNKTDMAA